MLQKKSSMMVAFACVLVSLFSFAQGNDNVNVTIRHAPYDVVSVRHKTERGDAPCKYCATTIRYDRKFEWNSDTHEWVETTDKSKIPDVCRNCQQAEKAQEKLNKRERCLDRDIKYQETKGRIEKKKGLLNRLRRSNR
mgnify:CR=1 FL=1